MVKTESARCGHSFEDMLKDYIDCKKGNDATSEFLTDGMSNVNRMSEEISSESTEVEDITTITVDDVFEIECSTVAEEIIIEDVKIFDTSSPNSAVVEVIGNDCIDELQSPIVENVGEIITDEDINSKNVLINNEFETFFNKIPLSNESTLANDSMEMDTSPVNETASQSTESVEIVSENIISNHESTLANDPMKIDASFAEETASQSTENVEIASKNIINDADTRSNSTKNAIEAFTYNIAKCATDDVSPELNSKENMIESIPDDASLQSNSTDITIVPSTNEISKPTNEVTDKPYKCHICGKLFSRNSSLKCHIRLHVEGPDSLLRGSSEPADSSLKTHIVELNPKKEEVVEPATDENTTDIAAVDEAASSVLNSSRDSCDLTEDEDKRDYKCIICEKSFSRRSSLTCHYKFHPKSPVSKSQDDIPVATISDETTMEVDQVDEPANKDQYKCEKCDRTFLQKNTYAWHLKMHETNVRKTSIDNTSSANLTDGINDIEMIDITSNVNVAMNNTDEPHAVDVNIYKCHLCPRSFPQLRGLKTHSGVHRRNRVDEQYKGPEILNTIVYEEVSSRKYACCTKNHNHDDEVTKLYKCNVCYKCFCDIDNLKAHLAHNHQKEDTSEASDSDHVVESDNNTVATINDSGTSHKEAVDPVNDDIKEQKMSISIRGLYKCGVCNETFDEIQLLGEHVNVHIQVHNESLLNNTDDSATEELCCVVCEKTFRSQNALSRHMNEHRRREEEILVRVTSSGRKIRERRSSDDLSSSSPIKCQPCNRIFESKRAKRIHDSSKHPVEQSENREPEPATETDAVCDEPRKEFICKCCNQQWISAKALNRHKGWCIRQNHNVEQSENDEPEPANETETDGEDHCKELVCECCNRQWSSTQALNRHKGWNKRRLSSIAGRTPVAEPPTFEEPDSPVPELIPIEDNKTESDVSSSVKCGCCNELFPNIPALNAHLSGQTNGTAAEAATFSPNHERNDMVNCDSLRDLVKCDRCDKFCSSIPALKLHIISDHTKKSAPQTSTKEPNTPKKTAESTGVATEAAKELPIRNENPTESVVDPPNEVQPQTNDDTAENLAVVRSKPKRSRKSADETIANQVLGDPSHHNLLQCDLCDETFASKRAFNSHKSTHVIDNTDKPEVRADVTSEAKTFACCDKTFSSSRALKVHQRCHSAVETVDIAPAADQQPPKRQKSATKPGKSDNIESNEDTDNATDSFVNHQATDTESEEDLFVEYKCSICNKQFATKKSLRYHREKHFKPGELDPEFDGEFSCEKCHKRFDKRTSLSVHKAYHTTVEKNSNAPIDYGSYSDMRNGIFKCNECDREFDTVKGAAMHFAKTHKEPQPQPNEYACTICDRTFSCCQGLAGHMSRHRDEASTSRHAQEEAEDFTCTDCDKSFASSTSLKKHRTTYHDNLNQTDPECICEICKKPFVSKCNLQRHRRFVQCEPATQDECEEEEEENEENTQNEYPCTYCDRIFENYRGLNGHMQVHQVYLCSNCDQEFITFRSYKVHIETEHANQDAEYACDKCDKSFSSAKSLRGHKSVHSNSGGKEPEPEPVEEFKCDKCDKSFFTLKSLGGHKAMHTKRGEEFDSENDENEPEPDDESAGEDADNEEEQPSDFPCPRCDRSFNNLRSLNMHVSTHVSHDNPLNLTCPQPQCNRVFVSHRSLSAHFSNHRREANMQDFPCPKCKETFTVMKAMYDHFYAKHKRAKEVERISRRSLTVTSNENEKRTVSIRSRSQAAAPVTVAVRKTRSKSVGDCARPRDENSVKSARSSECVNKENAEDSPASSSGLRKSRRLRTPAETTSAAKWSAEMTSISERTDNQPMEVDTQTDDENGDETANDNMQLSCVFNDCTGDIVNDTGSKPKCDMCSLTFDDLKSLAKHLADSHESTNSIDKKYEFNDLQIRIHQCTQCDRIFPNRVGLRRHSLSHSEPVGLPWEPPSLKLQCPLCSKILSTAIGLKRHSMSVHKVASKPQVSATVIPLPGSETKVLPKAAQVSTAAQPSAERRARRTVKSTKNVDHKPIKKSLNENESSKSGVNQTVPEPIVNETESSKANVDVTSTEPSSVNVTERSPSDVDLTIPEESFEETELSKSNIDQTLPEQSVKAIEGLTNGVQESPNVTNLSLTQTDDQIVLALETSSDRDDEPPTDTTQLSQSTSSDSVNPPPPPVAPLSKRPETDGRLSCKICLRQFDHAKAFNKHVQWHKFNDRAVDVEESVVNEDSSKQRRNSNGVQTNGMTSLEVLAYVKCEICAKTFTKADTLKQHAFDVHNVIITSPVLYQCNYCHKPFPRGRTLFVHLQSHANVNSTSSTPSEDIMPFECASCEKCFRLKDDLLEHVKSHLPDAAETSPPAESLVNGTAEESGEVNGNTGNDSGHSENFELKIHSEDDQQMDGDVKETKQDHESETARNSKAIYECPHCDKKYSRKCYLVTHIRIHTKKDDITVKKEEPPKPQPIMRRRSITQTQSSSCTSPPKPYQCPLCDKCYRSKSVLAVHEQKHSTARLVLRKSLKRANDGEDFTTEDGVRTSKRASKDIS